MLEVGWGGRANLGPLIEAVWSSADPILATAVVRTLVSSGILAPARFALIPCAID